MRAPHGTPLDYIEGCREPECVAARNERIYGNRRGPREERVKNGSRSADLIAWARRNGRYGVCFNCPHDVNYHAVVVGDGHCFAWDTKPMYKGQYNAPAVRCGCPGPHVKAFGRNG